MSNIFATNSKLRMVATLITNMILNGKLVAVGPDGRLIWPNMIRRIKRPISKRDAKSHAKSPRRERAKKYPWAFLTEGKDPPYRNQWGIP